MPNLSSRILVVFVALFWLSGCSGGLSARTRGMRNALDAGDPQRAISHLNRELGVKSPMELPKQLMGDKALLVLNRATIQQSVAQVAGSMRDYQAADKALDALDLSHGTADDLGRWLISDASGRYMAPPHEKLMINVLNMLNYLETSDLSGARVEARRMSVTARYLRDRQRASAEPSAALGVGSLLAGFAYEKSGNVEEARRYYEDAKGMGASHAVREAEKAPAMDDDGSEMLVIVGWGRVPHRVARHIPIGLALSRASPFLAAGDHDKASSLAAQGLVTWVSFPTLAPERPLAPAPSILVDGRPVPLDATLDLTAEVVREWKTIEGQVMAAAITRAVTRMAVGKAIEGAASLSDKEEVKAIGFLVSIFAQAAMTAADTPDTRSWETLPARLGIARIRVAPGEHRIVLEARGHRREGTVTVGAGGWSAVSLLTLR